VQELHGIAEKAEDPIERLLALAALQQTEDE
jgi:hypothetical protein